MNGQLTVYNPRLFYMMTPNIIPMRGYRARYGIRVPGPPEIYYIQLGTIKTWFDRALRPMPVETIPLPWKS